MDLDAPQTVGTETLAANITLCPLYLDQNSDKAATPPPRLVCNRATCQLSCTGKCNYNPVTRFEWDEHENNKNRAKHGGSFDTVLQTLANGRAGAMPVMVGHLDDAAIGDLVVYVQSLSGQKADAEMAARGKATFDMLCVACHQADGTGNQMLGAPNLTDGTWLYGGDPATIRETLTMGRNGNMPAFKDTLSEDRRLLLAAYVLSLSQ